MSFHDFMTSAWQVISSAVLTLACGALLLVGFLLGDMLVAGYACTHSMLYACVHGLLVGVLLGDTL